MFEFAKRSHWLQTLVVRLIAAMPPAVEHNVEKTKAIKKALYFAFLEKIEGDYVEFGTFEGTSLIAAFECDLKFRRPDTPPRTYWGFDSFEGFKYFDEQDRHPFFGEGDLASSYDKTRQRIERHFGDRADWNLVKGYFEDTIRTKTALEFGIRKISVAFIDCDLGSPARLALNFMAPALQNGTIFILVPFNSSGEPIQIWFSGACSTMATVGRALCWLRVLRRKRKRCRLLFPWLVAEHASGGRAIKP